MRRKPAEIIVDDRFRLSPSDKLSSLWTRLEKHLQERLALLRAQNDGDLGDVMTAKQRGRIMEIKALLELGEDDPVLE
jgi:hypothetical protein